MREKTKYPAPGYPERKLHAGHLRPGRQHDRFHLLHSIPPSGNAHIGPISQSSIRCSYGSFRPLQEDVPGREARILANEGCLYHCPYKLTHDCHISMGNMGQPLDTHRINQECSDACGRFSATLPTCSNHRLSGQKTLPPTNLTLMPSSYVDEPWAPPSSS